MWSRPQNWNWANTFISGQNVNITAAEWNNFCNRINEFRRYSRVGDYSFTSVSGGQETRASVANEARAAIQGMGYGASIPYIYARESDISVAYFNALRNELNNIP